MKKLAALLLLLLLPLQAGAMTQLVTTFGVANLQNATRYYSFAAGGAGIGGTLSNFEAPSAIAGTLSNLVVKTNTAPGAGQTVAIGLMINGVADADFTCTIAETATGCSDTTHTATIAVGDLVSWRSVSSVTAAVGDIHITAEFDGDTDGEVLIQGFTNGTMPNSATNYYSITGGGATTTLAHATSTMPASGIIDDLWVETAGAPGVGASYDITVFKNGVSTGITCQVSGTDESCTDLSASTGHTATFTAGDSISIETTPTGPPTARVGKWGMRFRPTTNGETPLFLKLSSFSNVPRWEPLTSLGQRYASEAEAQASTTATFIAKNLYWVNAYPAPTGAQSRTITLRNGGASTALTATLGSGSNQYVADVTNQPTITAGDLFNFQMDVASTPPTSNILWYASMVAYIAPPAAPGGVTDPGIIWFFDD